MHKAATVWHGRTAGAAVRREAKTIASDKAWSVGQWGAQRGQGHALAPWGPSAQAKGTKAAWRGLAEPGGEW